MKSEDLFAAIGSVESSRLERSELTAAQSSRITNVEETIMKRRNPDKLIRSLFIAAIVTAILSVTAYAIVNARIRLETTRYQNSEVVTEEPTGPYDVEVDFRRTTDEYLKLGSVYPQKLPEGYRVQFVSDIILGSQNIFYADSQGENVLFFAAMLGSEGQQFRLEDVTGEEMVTVCNLPGTLYHHGNGTDTIVWEDEAQGFGFTMHSYVPGTDLLAIAESVGPGEPLTPTLASDYDTALAQLGDYRVTALPDGYSETDFMASPLENGDGWYAYVRRWYADQITVDNTIYFEYEHFRLNSDEPMNHPAEPVAEVPETVLQQLGGGEPVTVQGMPGVANDNGIFWVDWDAQIYFHIHAPGASAKELLDLAQSVHRQGE